MGGFGSYFSNQAQQNQQNLPQNLQPSEPPSPEWTNPYAGQANPYQNYGAHSIHAPGQPIPQNPMAGPPPSPQEWKAQQEGTSIYNAPGGRGPGYGAAWPGFGYGGMPGRFGGGQFGGNPYGGFFGGSMYGGGGSPYGYGPGSYSPWSAGAMGYGGGSGMMGGPMRPFTGFNYNNLTSQMMGGPMEQQFQPLKWKAPHTPEIDSKLAEMAAAIAKLQKMQSGDYGDQRCCFVAGTIVQLANGRTLPIEQVKIGDELRGDTRANTVLDYHRPQLGNRILYSINGGKHFVTSEHPFYTPTGWKSFDPAATAEENPNLEVEALQIGDQIMLDNGAYLEIEKIGTTTAHPGTQLYNFKLDGDNTYYADGYLVHNKQGDGPGGGGPGGGGGGGGSGGCFAKGTQFKMADGSYKAVEDMDIGDLTEFGEVTDVMRGRSSRQWYDYLGTEVTDEHFVLEDGEWKYVKDSEHAVLIDPQDTYYTLNTEQHLLCGVNDVIFSDDAVFDTDHKPEWDEMLKVLNGGSSRTA